jgi:hypothetical protein
MGEVNKISKVKLCVKRAAEPLVLKFLMLPRLSIHTYNTFLSFFFFFYFFFYFFFIFLFFY